MRSVHVIAKMPLFGWTIGYCDGRIEQIGSADEIIKLPKTPFIKRLKMLPNTALIKKISTVSKP